jgi:hypothetical protein
MTELPVREMVLYKHGVGFFVRQGVVSADEVALAFRQDEINDVLKSLAVFDQAGGQVRGIHYQTPMDRADRLANSSIHLSDRASLTDLLRDLRGRRAVLTLETTPGTQEIIVGRIVGIEQPNAEMLRSLFDNSPFDAVPASALLSLLTDDGQVRVFRLSALRGIQIEDTQSQHDLDYFLDTSMSEDARRTVTVRLSEGDHDLVVYYVAPSPTWRVSYRLVAESDENAESGKALLQGWGLFDNRLEEDLENVRVTLVAGQPISFIYELYASRIPMRPTVQDESRIAPGPVEFAGAALALQPLDEDEMSRLGEVDAAYAPSPRSKRKGGPIRYEEAASLGIIADPLQREAIARATAVSTQTKEAGEFFQYEVTTPVSVKRGESALVPIIGSEISYQRELLYNGAKLPDHPVAAFRFDNTTGLTLERGPVTVVENGDYKGEAVVSFTKDGNQVYLPYAVELGVRITERPDHRRETTGLSIKDKYLNYQQYEVRAITYVIENTTPKPLTVTIEAPIAPLYQPFDTPPADVETASERRWRVSIPARAKTEFTRQERRRLSHHEELRRLDYQKLQDFMKNRWLDQATLDALSEMLDNLGLVQKAQAQKNEFAAERETIYAQQEQIRANLAALQPTGQEAALRNRVLAQLEAAQDRLEEIDRYVNALTQQIAQAEGRVNQIIADLGSGENAKIEQ